MGRSLGVRPVQRGTKPIPLGAGPGTRSHRREEIPAGLEPKVDVLEDPRLLVQRQGGHRVERDDGGEALGGKFQRCHIGGLKSRTRDQLLRPSDLDGRYVDAGYRIALSKDGRGWGDAAATKVEYLVTIVEQRYELGEPRLIIRPA